MDQLSSLNLNHLYYFWVIAKEGSVRRAAQLIHLTQPTLSDQLKTLETRLGQSLFERSGNRMHLTKYGLQILEHCEVIFQEGRKIIETSPDQTQSRPKVRIGILPDLSKHLICDFLSPVVEAQKAFLCIEEAEYKYLLKELELGTIDFVLVNEKDKSLKNNFIQKQIIENDFVAVCSKETRKRMSFRQLIKNTPYISYTKESSLHILIEKYFRHNKFDINSLCEVDDISLMKLITLSSNSFSILPESAAYAGVKNGTLSLLEKIPNLKCGMTLISKKTNQSSNLLSLFNV